jgi:hypothetical protein
MNIGSTLMRETDNRVFTCVKIYPLSNRFRIENYLTYYIVEAHNKEKQEYISVCGLNRIFVLV